MWIRPFYYSLCHLLTARHILSADSLPFLLRDQPMPASKPGPSPASSAESVFDMWLASRQMPGTPGSYFVPGAQRPLNMANASLAYSLAHRCAFDLFKVLWGLNPVRTTFMVAFQIVRASFPAFRGYSQALIIDELQTLIASGSFTWSRLFSLISTELLQRTVQGFLDNFAAANEQIVLDSAQFYIQHLQLQHRVRLDLPTLADPKIRDLLQESDIFAQSFSGAGFGLLSPLDFVRILSLATEIISHIFLILSLTGGITHVYVLTLSILTVVLPSLLSWLGWFQGNSESSPYSAGEVNAAKRQERMRNLAYNDSYRPEIALFGLEKWILDTWAEARNVLHSAEQDHLLSQQSFFPQLNLHDFTPILQNVPLVLLLQTSGASLGSLAVYRHSIFSMVAVSKSLVTTIKMAFQGIFIMSAFCTSMKLRPLLHPKEEDEIAYPERPEGGMSIDISDLSFTYPGSSKAALRDINLHLDAGESLAIVGYNGSGKSTLAKVLMRILDFQDGDLHINGVDIRRLNPSEYHRRLTGVFQDFSKFNSTVRENVGLGNTGDMNSDMAINHAISLAEAHHIIRSLPDGLKTILQPQGFESMSTYSGCHGGNHQSRSSGGLSGGEVCLLLFFGLGKHGLWDCLVKEFHSNAFPTKAIPIKMEDANMHVVS
ncbi:hypothetical protein AX16_000220 [Volvariella volvacea WC 439]|nr:hypothetical protein AX16_000220 [Volvariella volvacea WC 439]